jgi:hypothetical protein
MLLKIFLFLMLMFRAIHGSKETKVYGITDKESLNNDGNKNKESFSFDVPEDANIRHEVSTNIREKRDLKLREKELKVKMEMLSANEMAMQKFRPIIKPCVMNAVMDQRNKFLNKINESKLAKLRVNDFLETVERQKQSLRLIKENEQALESLLEKEELKLFEVSDANGSSYQFDDLGFRMIVRNERVYGRFLLV